jgi:type I restriction enzyme S subunit
MKPPMAANKTKKALVPKLRFKGFDSELILTKFDKVVESNLYGPRFNAEDYSENGNVKTIRGTDLGSDGEIKYNQVPLARLDKSTIANHKLLDGDIIMITTADCGLTGVFRKQEIDYLSSAYGVRIRLNEQGNPYYFKYFFQTRLAKKEINSFIRKATVANLPGSDILKIKLHLPTLPEQQKIAAFLSAVDEKIQQLTRKKELLEQYKKGVMQQLFPSTGSGQGSGKLRFKDSNGKAYPKWEEKFLGDIFYCAKGNGLSKEKLDAEGKYGCILYGQLYTTYKEVVRSVASKTNCLEGELSKIGDLLVPCSTTTTGVDLANVTAINIENVLLGGDITVLRTNEKIDNIFYAYYLTNFKKNKIASYAQGSTIIHLSFNHLKLMKIDLPGFEEQQKIATYLSSIDSKIEFVSKQITQTQTFKKGLLQQMFV